MPRQPRRIAATGVYHAILRGINRDAVFLEDEDWQRFLYALFATKQASGCVVLAYCLMPNHVHLVISADDEPIGLVIKRLGVRYAGWFNRKYGRVGHVFQDRFKSRPVEDDADLISLLRYVWNNPVKAGLVKRPDEYRWSSRRALGTPSLLVDEERLRRVLPLGALDDVADEAVSEAIVSFEAEPPKGRRPLHSADEVADLLETACGTSEAALFVRLPEAVQRSAIRQLRTRSVSYDQIAKATGLSRTKVQRMQAMGPPRAIFDQA